MLTLPQLKESLSITSTVLIPPDISYLQLHLSKAAPKWRPTSKLPQPFLELFDNHVDLHHSMINKEREAGRCRYRECIHYSLARNKVEVDSILPPPTPSMLWQVWLQSLVKLDT